MLWYITLNYQNIVDAEINNLQPSVDISNRGRWSGGGRGWKSRKRLGSASKRGPEVHIKQKFAFFLLISGVFKCLSLVQYWPGKSRLSGSRVVHPIIQEIILRPPRFENRHKRSGSNGGQNNRCLLNNYKYFMLNTVFTLLFLLIDSLSMKGVWLQS